LRHLCGNEGCASGDTVREAGEAAMIGIEQARDFANEWVSAWNAHDIEAILSHYADPPEHCSPLVVERLGRADGTIRDRAELGAYFLGGLQRHPPIRFELIDVFPGVASVAVLYRNHLARTVVEVMHLDASRKIVRTVVHYR
jgi:hypothetical protein